MPFETWIRRGHPVFFTLILICSIIELAISAWLTTRFNSHHNYRNRTERDRVRLLLFNSCWTILVSFIYLLLAFHSSDGSILTSIVSYGVVLFVTWILWTAGAAAITENLGGRLNCSHQVDFVYCGQLNALEGFAWIMFILLTLMLFVVIARAVLSGRRGGGVSAPLTA